MQLLSLLLALTKAYKRKFTQQSSHMLFSFIYVRDASYLLAAMSTNVLFSGIFWLYTFKSMELMMNLLLSTYYTERMMNMRIHNHSVVQHNLLYRSNALI